MNTCTISKLARAFGLSRSTLLYYDRIGLLPASGRTGSGYRTYTQADRRRLERICAFRQAGLPLAEIKILLSSKGSPHARVIEKRFRETGKQILDLRNKQRLLSGMLKKLATGNTPPTVDKKMWVEMLRAAGVNDRSMSSWHTEFERRAPEAHHEFLVSLGIPEEEIRRIREYSRNGAKP
jgi:DNA-binding transcriptional MerR regulator